MLPGMRQRTRVSGRWMGGGWSGSEEMEVVVVVVVDSGQNRLEDQRQLNGASALITLCSLRLAVSFAGCHGDMIGYCPN